MKKNPSVLILNGPNLNLTGTREPTVYGTETLTSICTSLADSADSLGIETEFFQSNHEGELIDKIQQAYGVYDGIIINAGAYSHYSYAIRDAIVASYVPTVEVHISNIYGREEFRHTSVIAPVCIGSIVGFGSFGYHLALAALIERFKKD